MLVEVVSDYEAISDRAAEIVTNQIRIKPDSVIGLATGGTPLGLYQRLFACSGSFISDHSNT